MLDLKKIRHSMARGGIPSLVEGVRPDTATPINTMVVTRNGTALFVSPSPVKRASWASRPSTLAKAQALAGSPDVVERESREADLCQQIERAMDGWSPPAGFLSITRTPTGAVRAIPVRGKPEVYKDALTMARILDRGLDVDVIALLGLGEKWHSLGKGLEALGSRD